MTSDQQTRDQHEEILACLANEIPHSRFKQANGQSCQWTYSGTGQMAPLPTESECPVCGWAGCTDCQQGRDPSGALVPAAEAVNGYDYRNQAWVVDGRYVACGHHPYTECGCFGLLHAGEPVAANAEVR